MATFTTTLATPLTPEEAFGYLADLRNLRDWDPGTEEVARVSGSGEEGTEYAVKLSFGVRPVLRYRITEYESPRRIRFRASTAFLTSDDCVEVWPAASGGAIVRYDATLSLRGPLRLMDSGAGVFLRRLGAKAARGLRGALGARV